jgi:colicin import membrane protein
MTAFVLKPGDLASPWMILLSLGFHGLLICGILLTYSHMSSTRIPTPRVVTRVKLVARTEGPPKVHKMGPVPVNRGPTARPRGMRREKAVPVRSRHRRRTVKSKTLKAPAAARIPLAKHKPPRRVAKPKPEKPKAPPTRIARKGNDPERLIEERIRRIQERIEHGRAGASTDSEAGRELSDWLERVRERLNDHWSVFRDDRSPGKPARISIDIADDGSLNRASIRESSGDDVFDRSAMRAAYRAAPYPVVPPEVRQMIKAGGGLVLRFTPGGIR